jgi:hypothetical protein
VFQATDHFGFFVTDRTKPRGLAWTWRKRLDPKKPKVDNAGRLVVRPSNYNAVRQSPLQAS